MTEMSGPTQPAPEPVFGGGAREIFPYIQNYSAAGGIKDFRPLPQAEESETDPKDLPVVESVNFSPSPGENVVTAETSPPLVQETTVSVEKDNTSSEVNIGLSRQASSSAPKAGPKKPPVVVPTQTSSSQS